VATIKDDFGPDSLFQHGPIIRVRVGWDPNFNPNGSGVPNIPAHEYLAVLDTGASHCVIDSALVRQLSLPFVREDVIHGIESVRRPIHSATVHAPQFDVTQHGEFYAGNTPEGRSILLGRIFLRRFTMIYEGRTGTITLSND
jgi:hypothetical protein